MEITLTTPALLFPAISLLLVAYTNRFLALGNRIRNLNSILKSNPDHTILSQIKRLRRRVYLIKNMQAFGVSSLLCCVLCMFCLFAGKPFLGKIVFGASLILMMISLSLSLREIIISVQALEIELQNIEDKKKTSRQ
ncbi:MAG: DUF2721 domain-containing protein [Desulfobacteraceae bacterium]|jgi:hypothetical protein